MPAFKPQPVPDPLPQPGGKLAKGAVFSNSLSDAPPPGDPFGRPPGRFKQFYQNNKWYFWAIIVGVIIIGVLGFFAFRKQAPEPTKDADVTIGITAPETAPSGGEVIYKIQIDNHDKSDLVDMNLELVYEDGISYVSSVPAADNLSGSQFPVPDLKNGENAVLVIKTTASGNINEEKSVTAKLHYKFSNFNSEFTKEASHSVRLVSADIVLDVTGPDRSSNVQSVNYDIYYRNDSDKSIDGARIQITYPSEFHFAGSTPNPSLSSPGQNVWNLSNLDKNASGKISFNGDFKGSRSGQSAVFKIEFLAMDDTGSYFTQSSTTYMTTIEAQPLSAEQRLVNDISNGVVQPGGTVQYEVKFQNNTDVVATGVQVVVDIDSKAVDNSTIRANGGLVQDHTITWNASSESKLERLGPQASGTVTFSFQLKNPAVNDGSKNVVVVTKPRIKSNENPSFLNGNDITLKVASPSSIERSLASAGGSIPPRVGQETVMTVSVSLRNGSNDYREGVLVGYVPLGVVLDKTSIPANESAAIKFDAATGKLSWTVGQLAAHSGSSSPLRTLKFNVKLTPTSNQVGQAVTLFKNITFTAKDSFTELPISLNAQEVNTDNLGNDGSGRVQP